LVISSVLDRSGRLVYGDWLELVRDWVIVEGLFFPGLEPPDELVRYVATNRASTIAGANRGIDLLPSEHVQVGRKHDGLG
jgi:hypothetical protein